MRFIEDGPAIPDALLERRDRGQVVFLCGAGVSVPSGLPDFGKLTQQVVQALDPEKDSDTAKAFDGGDVGNYSESKVPLDQIYQLLDLEYGRDEVDKLVTNFLTDTSESEPRREHKLIAKISSDLEGRPQIVTTNFDRLFDKCQGVNRIFEPPAFPEIELGMPVHGVTHLHGRLPKSNKPSHGYILSSADFGQAYLAEGWATRFVRALLDKFTVALVGYQAEDPPIKYLLQGLSRDGRMDKSSIYAFNKGASEEVEVKWQGRGVYPIAYSNHCDLWNTLEAWASRVDDSTKWKNSVVAMARQNPRTLKPHERGQVAHLVRTASGAKLFAQSEPSPPAEWLCVFDGARRVAKIGKSLSEGGEEFDPLAYYRLDDDPVRANIVATGVPFGYDNLIEWRRGDTNPTTAHNLIKLQAGGNEAIPRRLRHLINWSSKHLNDPCLAWWAARYTDLHPRLTNRIRWQMASSDDLHIRARNTWNLILEAMKSERRWDHDEAWSNFRYRIESDGWTKGTLRDFNDSMGPFLLFKPPVGIAGAKPPDGTWDDISLHEIARIDVEFPNDIRELSNVPDRVLAEVFRIAESHLRRALTLYHDVGTKHVTTSTCYPGRHVYGKVYSLDNDAYFRWFVGLLDRMADKHQKELRLYAEKWDHEDRFFFRKLKLFVLNDSRIFEANEAAELLMQLSHDGIWDCAVRRELLFLLTDRWCEFADENKVALIDRLLAGPRKVDGLSSDSDSKLDQEMIACYLRWLEIEGCQFSDEQSSQLVRIINKIPDWSEDSARRIVAIHGASGGFFSTDYDSQELASLPVGEIVERANSETGPNYETRTNVQSFKGLVKDHPRIALAALSVKSRKKIYPLNRWHELISDWPENVSARLNRVFFHRISRLPEKVIQDLSNVLAERVSFKLHTIYAEDPTLAWNIFDVIVSAVVSNNASSSNDGTSESRTSALTDRHLRRTYENAINEPIGKLTEEWVKALNSLQLPGSHGIPAEFKCRLETLLAASSAGRDHAVAIVASQINWLYFLEPAWVLDHVVPWLDFSHPSAESAWSGHLYSNTFFPQEVGELVRQELVELFPKIYEWDWNAQLSNRTTKLIIELCIYRLDEPDGLTAIEAGRCLKNMSSEDRRSAIFCLNDVGRKERNGWRERVIPFIDNAWPRERKFKTTDMVSAWVTLLGGTGDDFPVVLNCVRSFLVPTKREGFWLHRFTREGADEEPLTAKHPCSVLELLHAIIPNDPMLVPYDLSSILEIIRETNPSLTRNAKYVRLIDLVEQQ